MGVDPGAPPFCMNPCMFSLLCRLAAMTRPGRIGMIQIPQKKLPFLMVITFPWTPSGNY